MLKENACLKKDKCTRFMNIFHTDSSRFKLCGKFR